MKIKKEYIILLAIILLLTLYLIFHKEDRTHYKLPEVPEIVEADITKIELVQESSIVMNRKDNSWRITPQGYLADKNMVSDMLDTIEELSLTDLVSESESYP